jgi:cell wall-associated NlpC family hydrolase
MIRKSVKIAAYAMTAVMLFSGNYLTVNAAGISSVLPGGGVNISLVEGPTTEELLTSGGGTVSMIEALLDKAAVEQAKREAGVAEADLLASEDEQLKTLVIAQVHDYVNVRSIPSEEGDIIGKLYNNSVGTFVAEENGWYQITSGSVTGYVKGEFCITGEDAIALAKEVSTRIATVNTQTLKVRKEPSVDAEVLGLVPMGDTLVVSEEVDGWVKVDVEEGIGWVSTEFVDLSREFVQAESKEEEAKRLDKEAKERKAAREAAAAKAAKSAQNNSSSTPAPIPVIPSGDSAMGSAVAQYAVQFVGNPYVYGGSSLTNGADCSGFVMSVYANFGVSLPHSSAADRKQGYGVDGLANAQPGDLICYSGHVAMYIGDGQIVHASTRKTGIIISKADYKKILAIRRIF